MTVQRPSAAARSNSPEAHNETTSRAVALLTEAVAFPVHAETHQKMGWVVAGKKGQLVVGEGLVGHG